jgi:hypothetical protein
LNQKRGFFGIPGLEFLTVSRYRCASSIANRERHYGNISTHVPPVRECATGDLAGLVPFPS